MTEEEKVAEQAIQVAQKMYAEDFSLTMKSLVESVAIVNMSVALLAKKVSELSEKMDCLVEEELEEDADEE